MNTDAHETREIKRETTTKSLRDKWTLIADVIMRDPSLSAAAKCVAARLMWHMNCRYETCWPSQRTLAADLGMAPNTILAAIKALVSAGYVIAERRQDTSSLYRFNWSHLPGDDTGADQEPASYFAGGGAAEIEAKHGNSLTRESSLSSKAAPQKKGGAPKAKAPKWTDKPLSERMGRDGVPVTQEGDPDWAAMVWEVQLPMLIVLAMRQTGKPVSQGSARGRIGKLIKAKGAHETSRMIAELFKSGPGGDPFDYLEGMKRVAAGEEDMARKAMFAPIDY